jgi:amidase
MIPYQLLGKASTENSSCCPSSFSSMTGPVHNPYAFGRTTGGSSSGCACLVSGGEVDMALGADVSDDSGLEPGH